MKAYFNEIKPFLKEQIQWMDNLLLHSTSPDALVDEFMLKTVTYLIEVMREPSKQRQLLR